MWCRSRDGVKGPSSRGSSVGVVYCTILYWNVFVEIIKEPYISAAAPHGLLLPADLHTGRRVMKQASLEIHRFGEPRQFSPYLPPTLLSLLLSRVFFFFSFLSHFWSVKCATVHLVQTQHSLRELTSCQTSVPASWLTAWLVGVSFCFSIKARLA